MQRITSVEEATKLMSVLASILKHMNILTPVGLEDEIFRTATMLGITAYDSSYIVLAQEHNLVLVTEDQELREKCKGIIETRKLKRYFHDSAPMIRTSHDLIWSY